MSGTQKVQRRTTVVEKRLQYGFAVKILVVHAIVALSYHAAVQIRISKHLSVASEEQGILLSRLMSDSFFTLLVVTAITGPLVFLLALWQSNRLLGPLPRFRRAFSQLAQGDFAVRVVLRPGDTLEPFADCFNRAAETLQGRGESSEKMAQPTAEEPVEQLV